MQGLKIQLRKATKPLQYFEINIYISVCVCVCVCKKLLHVDTVL